MIYTIKNDLMSLVEHASLINDFYKSRYIASWICYIKGMTRKYDVRM